MALGTVMNTVGASFFYSPTTSTSSLRCQVHQKPGRLRPPTVHVKSEAINPEIRKNEDKVVDSVQVAELSKPLTAYCRCWRSGTFPLCDGSHVKHNKATGDNVGPLLIKKAS